MIFGVIRECDKLIGGRLVAVRMVGMHPDRGVHAVVASGKFQHGRKVNHIDGDAQHGFNAICRHSSHHALNVGGKFGKIDVGVGIDKHVRNTQEGIARSACSQ